MIFIHWPTVHVCVFQRILGQFSGLLLDTSQHFKDNELFRTSWCYQSSQWSASTQHVVGDIGTHLPMASDFSDSR